MIHSPSVPPGPNRRFRRVAGLLVLALLTGLAACRPAFKPQPYNIVIVTLDTTRADRIGCYGYPEAITPHLDQLAREGVRFSNCRTPVPLTLPAHTTLLTGLYPPEHGLRVNGLDQLAPDIATLPLIFSNAGYRCGAFVAATVLDARHGLDRGCEIYDDEIALPKITAEEYERTGHLPDLTPPMRPGNQVIDAALAWLETVKDDRFFAWVHLYDPHYPYERHDDFPQLRRPEAYDEEIAYADFQVGRLLQWLHRQGLKSRTVLLVCGDHGESLGEHGEATHGLTLYDSALRVPFLLSGPKGLRAEAPIDEPVGLIDVFPTLLASAGLTDAPRAAPQIARSKGRNLLPLLRGGEIPRRSLYAETIHPYHEFGWAPLQSLIDRDWKIIRAPRRERFELDGDPRELTNRWDDSESSRAAFNQLLDFEKTLERTLAVAQPMASEDIRKLEALGYVAGGQASIAAAYTNTDAWAELFHLRDIKDGLAISRQSFSIRARIVVNEVGDEVLEQARHLVAASPETVFFHNLLGCIHLRRDEFEPAVAALTRALALNPDYSESLNNLAMAYIVQNRFADAEPLLRRDIENMPQSLRAHKSMGYVMLKTNRPKLAREHFEFVLRREPQSHGAHRYLGEALEQLGDETAARDHYAESLRLNPGWISAALPLARLLLTARDAALRDPTRALQVAWEACEAAEHRDAQALVALADAYQALNRPHKVREALDEAIALVAPADPAEADRLRARRDALAPDREPAAR